MGKCASMRPQDDGNEECDHQIEINLTANESDHECDSFNLQDEDCCSDDCNSSSESSDENNLDQLHVDPVLSRTFCGTNTSIGITTSSQIRRRVRKWKGTRDASTVVL